MVIGNANILPGIDLRNTPGVGIVPINVPINETTECSRMLEIALGKPEALSEHSGASVVAFIGTFVGAIPIPRAFLSGQNICIPHDHSLCVCGVRQHYPCQQPMHRVHRRIPA